MNWMNKLERKFGRYAVPNLSRYFVFAVIIGYVIWILAPNLLWYMSFSAEEIFHGQVWRLVTWIFVPGQALDFWAILSLFFVWLWGVSLESYLGTFRMNVFLIQAVLLTDLVGLLYYAVVYAIFGPGFPVEFASCYYILMTMLLAIAILLPEAEVRIYFVLPIKMKWMLLFELALLAYNVYSIFRMCIPKGAGQAEVILGLMFGFEASLPIITAVGSMFLFFWLAKARPSRRQRKRQKEFRMQAAKPRPGSGITQHKCAICGRTEADAPNMTFRYCSKCKGNMEYCEEHLFTHRHVE